MRTKMPDDQFNLTYFSPKVEKRISPIQGKGLFANANIEKGQVVVVKGGYVLTKNQRDEIGKELGPSEIQITEHLFISPASRIWDYKGRSYLLLSEISSLMKKLLSIML